jgi:hypothetical protein
MESILSLIFSKLGALGAILMALGGLWLRGWWYKSRAERAEREREGLQVQVEITQAQGEITAETERRKEKIDEMVQSGDAAGLSAYFNRRVQSGDKS